MAHVVVGADNPELTKYIGLHVFVVIEANGFNVLHIECLLCEYMNSRRGEVAGRSRQHWPRREPLTCCIRHPMSASHP